MSSSQTLAEQQELLNKSNVRNSMVLVRKDTESLIGQFASDSGSVLGADTGEVLSSPWCSISTVS